VSVPAGRIATVTTATAHQKRGLLLSLLTLLTLISAIGFGPAIDASASTRAAAETRVRAIDTPTTALVAARDLGSSTGAGVSSVWLRQLVSATGVATNSVLDDLAIAERHLGSIDAMTPPNRMMLDRIAEAQQAGRALTQGEQSFLTHETTEAALRAQGLSQDAAHAAALKTHPLYGNYDPEVIKAFPEHFNSNWRKFWGLE